MIEILFLNVQFDYMKAKIVRLSIALTDWLLYLRMNFFYVTYKIWELFDSRKEEQSMIEDYCDGCMTWSVIYDLCYVHVEESFASCKVGVMWFEVVMTWENNTQLFFFFLSANKIVLKSYKVYHNQLQKH